jgi:DNA-directed RNA polymerase subunit M/transcription elongation factor TFIIS
MVDLKCPKCGSDNTQRVKLEVFDENVKSLWWMIVVLVVLGVAIHPIVLLFAFAVILLLIIVNMIHKHNNRNHWILQCSRCGYQFTITNPDRIDMINAQNEAKREKQSRRAVVYAEKNKKTVDALNQNGQLENDEVLLNTVDYFSPHKNSYTLSSQLKITNKALVCFNAKRTLRLPKENVIYIKKKNYALIIPTGIQICMMENGKKKRYNFVVYAGKQRKEIIKMLNEWKLNSGSYE